MMGSIEWVSKERDEIERANVTRCVAREGVYYIEFASSAMWSEGLMKFSWGGEQQTTTGQYGYTDGSYSGEAEVVGRVTTSPDLLEFTGTWHDPADGTGQWDVYVAIEDAPGQEFTFRYDDPDAPRQ